MSSYREHSGINFSTLKEIDKSPLDYKIAVMCPKDSSKEQKLGTMIHCGLLEPEKFKKIYRKMPTIHWGNNDAKAATVAELLHQELIPRELADTALGLKKADLEHLVFSQSKDKILVPESSDSKSDSFTWEKANRIIEQNKNKDCMLEIYDHMEAFEKELYGICEVTGLELKGLADILTRHALVDLKTVGCLGKRFHNLRAFQYVDQVAYYDYLCRLNGITKPSFFILWIETCSPYKMKMTGISQQSIELAHQRNIERLKKLKECIENDSFTDGSEEVEWYEDRANSSDSDSGFEVEEGQDDY